MPPLQPKPTTMALNDINHLLHNIGKISKDETTFDVLHETTNGVETDRTNANSRAKPAQQCENTEALPPPVAVDTLPHLNEPVPKTPSNILVLRLDSFEDVEDDEEGDAEIIDMTLFILYNQPDCMFHVHGMRKGSLHPFTLKFHCAHIDSLIEFASFAIGEGVDNAAVTLTRLTCAEENVSYRILKEQCGEHYEHYEIAAYDHVTIEKNTLHKWLEMLRVAKLIM